MSSIASTLATDHGSLIGYLPVGFPDLDTSITAAIALAENGVDALELGLPYSDPVMDGPVIQAATTAALENGFRTADLFTAVKEIRAAVDVPVLAMTYWNLILQHGVDAFADDLLAAGGSGVITPDLIPDEGGAWIAASERTGLDRVFLAAPSSPDARLHLIDENSRGFVYVVSTMGVTGTRAHVDSHARELVARLRPISRQALCVGLGISTGEQVADVLSYADGEIVGSAFVRALASGGVDAVAETAAALSAGKAH